MTISMTHQLFFEANNLTDLASLLQKSLLTSKKPSKMLLRKSFWRRTCLQFTISTARISTKVLQKHALLPHSAKALGYKTIR